MRTFIGVDLGGTHVRVATVTEKGEVLEVIKGESYGQKGPGVVIPNIIKMIKELKDYDKCSGIGIGVPGPVDTLNKWMSMSTNLPGFTKYPVTKELEEVFHMPVYIDNDANVAGLAEALVGAGKGLNTVYYVTISTGIGGALVANRKVVSGANGYAGEIANIIIDRNREKVNHLNAGAVENEASGTALIRKYNALYPDHPVSSARKIFEGASENDPECLKIIDGMAYDLAMMFSAIGHVCDPNMFVIGGGVMKSKDVFLPKVIEYYKGLVHAPMANVPFVEAELDEPGIIGAAMLPLSNE